MHGQQIIEFIIIQFLYLFIQIIYMCVPLNSFLISVLSVSLLVVGCKVENENLRWEVSVEGKRGSSFIATNMCGDKAQAGKKGTFPSLK
jgi:hypothetical protein